MMFPNRNLTSPPVRVNNFTPLYSASVTTSDTSDSITFPNTISSSVQTVMILNTGSYPAYIGWGNGSATATVSTDTPNANCFCIPANTGFILDLISTDGKTLQDTIAFIDAGDSTTLEITVGFGS